MSNYKIDYFLLKKNGMGKYQYSKSLKFGDKGGGYINEPFN